VLIVSENPETRDGLDGYLRRAGVVSASTRLLDDAAGVVAARGVVVVLFPDDFTKLHVTALLVKLGSLRPRPLVVLVTRDAKQFLARESYGGVPLLVLPKPAWGWTILDAISAHLFNEGPDRCGQE
jgi:DNA-binding NtrC family response regulator